MRVFYGATSVDERLAGVTSLTLVTPASLQSVGHESQLSLLCDTLYGRQLVEPSSSLRYQTSQQ